MSLNKQIVFDLSKKNTFERENFFISPSNFDAVSWIDRWPDWPSPALVIHGPIECGKTHLCHIFSRLTGAKFITDSDLESPEFSASTESIIIDDAEDNNSESLLHLYNLQVERGGTLLLTSRKPPSNWLNCLPDLSSRLSSALVVSINEPDDELLKTVIIKHFSDKQLYVPPDVVDYLSRRVERSFLAVSRTVSLIDKLALSESREISIPLVKKVLDSLES